MWYARTCVPGFACSMYIMLYAIHYLVLPRYAPIFRKIDVHIEIISTPPMYTAVCLVYIDTVVHPGNKTKHHQPSSTNNTQQRNMQQQQQTSAKRYKMTTTAHMHVCLYITKCLRSTSTSSSR